MRRPLPLYVVDSSVAYKWFNSLEESGVEDAWALLAGHQSGTLVLAAPAHLPSEVINGLRYAKLEAAALRLAIEGLSDAGLVTVPLDAELLSTALDLALTHDLTIHDALFPALAVQLQCELVTADKAQARVRDCAVRLLR